jgi:hypothetical protein
MGKDGLSSVARIVVVFETRQDGGLRVYSDDVPGFMLSHPDYDAVMRDVQPALEQIIGSMVGGPVTVEPVDKARSLPWFRDRQRETREYETRRAA